MNFCQKIQEIISWEKSIDEQLDILAEFDGISDEEVLELLNCVKRIEAGILIEYLGFERLKSYLYQILEVLQDINWPAAKYALKVLQSAGESVIPEIKKAFENAPADSMWHYWILTELVESFDYELVMKMKPELIHLVEKADRDSAAIQALSILKSNNFLTLAQFQSHYDFLLEAYRAEEAFIQELNAFFD